MNDHTSNAALVEKYADVAYAGQSNALSHPDRMAVVAKMFGLSAPDVARCRVLELGCNAGANLLPMAESLPEAEFMGCDLSSEAIAAARRTAAEAGIGNATFVEQDLAALFDASGEFDYLIAHGVYSWVPARVRDAMFELARKRLKANGVMFVSYNVYPGCHVRQAVWEVLGMHTERAGTPQERLARGRELAAALAEPGLAQNRTDALLREEFKRVAQVSDSALFHDDLAEPNDPVYFRDFVAHAARHGLAFLAEAQPVATVDRLPPLVQRVFAGLDRLEREQYLDFACLRRFRQSLLCRAEAATDFAFSPKSVASMHVAATAALVRAAAAGQPLVDSGRPDARAGAESQLLRALLEWLVAIAPDSVPIEEVQARLAWNDAQGAARSLEAILADAWLNDSILLQLRPSKLAPVAGDAPLASALCRWQAAHGARITNLRHETMQIQDSRALRLLPLLDGRRKRAEIGAAMDSAFPDARAAERWIDDYLRQFGRHALLLG